MHKILIGLLVFIFSTTVFSANTSGIEVGDIAPQIALKDIDGKAFDLRESLQYGPVVLVFYRGGWCPYCNRQLKQLQTEIVPKLSSYNAKLVAISVDKIDEIEKTKKKASLGMTLISDSMAAVVKQYRVVNQTSDSLVKTYKEQYNIDLERSSGQKHHIIAIPSLFTISQDGRVAFAYVNEDYTVRAQSRDILSSLSNFKNKNR